MTNWPRLNLAAGPVEVMPQTLHDLARPTLYHYDPAFIELFAHTTDLLKRVFRTEYDVVIMQGEAILGLEAAAASLIRPGDKVLNLVSGVFGKWFQDFIEKFGGETIEVAVGYDDAVDPEEVRKALHANPGVRYCSMVHSETPSGTHNPVRAIGNVCREFGVLTMVDTVSGLGGELLSPEEWGIDVAIAGPQKCLGGTPGLSLIAVSPAAWERMEAVPNPLRGSFLSILDWKTAWLEGGRFPYTPSVNEMYALQSVLSAALDTGMERFVERQQAVARACRAAVRALGLHLWPVREEIAATCVTAVKMPEGLTDAAIRDPMRHKFGVMISPGYGPLHGKLVRLGHMGPAQAHPTVLAAQLAVFERVLKDAGLPITLGTGVGAAMESLADWDDAA
jgi:pyridoxamine---pyruvate transaminase